MRKLLISISDSRGIGPEDDLAIQPALYIDYEPGETDWPDAGKDGWIPSVGVKWGVWRSHSPYLGNIVTGNFYIARIDFPEPGRWRNLVNPTGLFFDKTSNSPFLTLYDFNFTYKAARTRYGKLENKSPVPFDGWITWHQPSAT